MLGVALERRVGDLLLPRASPGGGDHEPAESRAHHGLRARAGNCGLIDCRPRALGGAVESSQPAESFRNQLLRYRGRTHLTQREFAERIGVHPRSVGDWEMGVNHPSAARLQAVIAALLEVGGLTTGQEMAEAQELWAAVERDAARMRTPFDSLWFARLLAEHHAPPDAHVTVRPRGTGSAAEHRHEWGDAPDPEPFVGRSTELGVLRHWVLDECCRLLAVVGMGGIGKTSLAAKLAHEVAPRFERVYWRSLRDAPPVRRLAGRRYRLSVQPAARTAAKRHGALRRVAATVA